MPFTLEHKVGRLVELRLEQRTTLEEAQQIRIKMYLMLGSMPGKVAVITDLLRADPFSSDVADKTVEMFKRDNPKIERTAFVMRDGAFTHQIERIALDAARATSAEKKMSPQRRVFRDKLQAFAWLGEVLTDAERARLEEVVDEMP
jgi:hypothetical protein